MERLYDPTDPDDIPQQGNRRQSERVRRPKWPAYRIGVDIGMFRQNVVEQLRADGYGKPGKPPLTEKTIRKELISQLQLRVWFMEQALEMYVLQNAYDTDTLNKEEIAEALGIDRSTLYDKFLNRKLKSRYGY